MTEAAIKHCTKCDTDKPLSEFNKDSTKKDGAYPSCKVCYAKYYASIRSKKLEWKRGYREKNKERIAEYRAQHYTANADEYRKYAVDWAKQNPEACRINQQNRRARKRAGGKLSPGLTAKLYKLQRGKCACGCKQPLGDDYHRDHIMPLALGGTNTDDNIQLLRPTCNLQKSAKHPINFMQQRGFLL